MKAFIAPDVHGNLDLLAGLLRQEGIIDEGGERIDTTTRTIQLGDLCNCVGSSVIDDNRCLDHVGKWFDDYLVGNHEHPYFGGPRFSGFWADSALRHRVRRAITGAAVAVDGVLVTHAGLAPEWETEADTADEAADWLNEVWNMDPTACVFSQVGGARGGGAQFGGTLWADWSEPKAFRQLVGHTPGAEARYLEGPGGWLAVCIDVGGKHGERLVGAWLRDGELEVVAARRDAGVVT